MITHEFVNTGNGICISEFVRDPHITMEARMALTWSEALDLHTFLRENLDALVQNVPVIADARSCPLCKERWDRREVLSQEFEQYSPCGCVRQIGSV